MSLYKAKDQGSGTRIKEKDIDRVDTNSYFQIQHCSLKSILKLCYNPQVGEPPQCTKIQI